MPDKKSLYVAIGLIVATACIVLAFVLFSNKAKEENIKRINSLLHRGARLVLQGDAGLATPALEQARSEAQTSTQKAIAAIALSAAYLQSGEATKGVELLKQTTQDTSLPSYYRARAAENVLVYYSTPTTPEFNEQTIFTGAIWGSFVENKEKTIEGYDLAARDGFVWAQTLAGSSTPLLYTPYRLASWYGARAVLPEYSESERTEFKQLAQRYLEVGDNAYSQALAKNELILKNAPSALVPYPSTVVGLSLASKASAMKSLYVLKVDNISFDDVIRTYDEAIEIQEGDGNMNSRVANALYTRLSKAGFLVNESSQKYKQEILDTLTPVYKPELRRFPFFTSYLAVYRGVSSDKPAKKNMLLLANIDPRFKNLLIELGWEKGQF